jgi:hypothetical protein
MADNMGVNPFVSSGGDIQLKAKELVLWYTSENRFTSPDFTLDNIFVVWFAKTLGNWKAVLSTSLSDGYYYEVTHNGAKHETYLDVYAKVDHERYAEAVSGE